MSNPYEILGVSKNADEAAIKSAYRKLVMKYHPDKNPGDKAAEEKFKAINNAFDILKDPQKRAAYDRYGEAAFAGGNGASAGAGGNPFGGGFNGNPFGGGFSFNMGGNGMNMDDILREAMRGFGFGDDDESAAPSRGRDMLHEVSISLQEAYFGKTETIRFSSNIKCQRCNGNGTDDGKPAPVCEKCRGTGVVHTRRGMFYTEAQCPECQGLGRIIKKKCRDCDGSGVVYKNRTLEVKIPAGVQDGARLRVAGQGEAAAFDGQPGDFFIDVRVRPDSRFARRGNDLFVRAVAPFAVLALGGEIVVETIDDKQISVKVAAGTQLGERLRVKGKGMPGGDMFVEIATEIPKSLSRAQKKALEEFSSVSG
ncbi:MAG: molecular chaperone DnaJ [Rickettsiales bacterium]|jgi:molecular chaperone DnaJ|nr:molecular chaperone DnaJ [Rickettsiales bacterium]